MEKLIQGILEFRRHVFPAYRMTFARLAGSQQPDCLFVACADSRVVPNLFASTQPGDLFVVRNVGNLIPPHRDPHDRDPHRRDAPSVESSVPAALEFALQSLQARHVVVCGHSNCGAMRGLLHPPRSDTHLAAWLSHGAQALRRLRAEGAPDRGLSEVDQLSQVNVLTQVEHVETYPFVRERIRSGHLRVHGWWFDVGTAEVHVFDPERRRFAPIDEAQAARMLTGTARLTWPS